MDVHGSTIGGDIENQNVAEVETWKTEKGARFVRWMADVPPPPTFVASGGFQGNIDRRAEFEYIAPRLLCNLLAYLTQEKVAKRVLIWTEV